MKRLQALRYDTECQQCGTRLRSGETCWLYPSAYGWLAYCVAPHRGGTRPLGEVGVSAPQTSTRHKPDDRASTRVPHPSDFEWESAKNVSLVDQQPLVDVWMSASSLITPKQDWAKIEEAVRGRKPLLLTGETEPVDFLFGGFRIRVRWSRYDFGDYYAEVTVMMPRL